jgi:hypothetical protein
MLLAARTEHGTTHLPAATVVEANRLQPNCPLVMCPCNGFVCENPHIAVCRPTTRALLPAHNRVFVSGESDEHPWEPDDDVISPRWPRFGILTFLIGFTVLGFSRRSSTAPLPQPLQRRRFRYRMLRNCLGSARSRLAGLDRA